MRKVLSGFKQVPRAAEVTPPGFPRSVPQEFTGPRSFTRKLYLSMLSFSPKDENLFLRMHRSLEPDQVAISQNLIVDPQPDTPIELPDPVLDPSRILQADQIAVPADSVILGSDRIAVPADSVVLSPDQIAVSADSEVLEDGNGPFRQRLDVDAEFIDATAGSSPSAVITNNRPRFLLQGSLVSMLPVPVR